MVYQTARAQDKAIQLVGRIEFLDSVEQAGDDIVSARSLAARKDDTHVHGSKFLGFAFHQLQQRHSVRVGEQFLNFFLVSYRLSRFAFLYLNGAQQRFRQFRLISSSCNL